MFEAVLMSELGKVLQKVASLRFVFLAKINVKNKSRKAKISLAISRNASYV